MQLSRQPEEMACLILPQGEHQRSRNYNKQGEMGRRDRQAGDNHLVTTAWSAIG